MNRAKIAACTLALALTAITSGSAFGANYGGWAAKSNVRSYGGSFIVPAASDQRHMTGRKFRRGNKHNLRRGNKHKFGRRDRHRFAQRDRHRFGKRRGHRHGFRHRHGRHRFSFAFVFPYYFPYYGHRPYYRYGYDDPYVPPAASAQAPEPAPAYPQPAEPAPATPEVSSYCREIIMDVVIGGVEQTAYGTACRQPDGSWKIAN